MELNTTPFYLPLVTFVTPCGHHPLLWKKSFFDLLERENPPNPVSSGISDCCTVVAISLKLAKYFLRVNSGSSSGFLMVEGELASPDGENFTNDNC